MGTKIEISLSRKIAFGYCVALLALVSIGVVSYRSTRDFVESADIVRRSHRILALLQTALSDAVSAESEARGYVITGNEQYLQLYETAAGDLEGDLKDLRRLAMDPTILRRLDDLERMARNRMDWLHATVDLRRTQGFEAVRQAAGTGKRMMDELRGVVADIESQENRLLVERDRLARSLERRTLTVVILGSLFAILLAAASAFIIATDIAHKERLEKEVLEISEREQRRIGQDLHDGLCQHLTGIALLSRSLQQKLGAQASPETDCAVRITGLLNEGIDQVRRVTRGLHPVPDEPTGLTLALQDLASAVGHSGAIACRLECPDPVPIPDRTAATHLYRIAQEAVQNAIRHARPSNIVVRLGADEDSIRLAVIDDGVGLPAHRGGKGMGLEIMNYRARTIGAQLSVEPAAPRGTAVTCVLPRDALGKGEIAS